MANQTVNIDIQVQSKTLAQLESELEQINSELKDVAIGSDAFKQLSKDAQRVTGELDKVNKEIEGFTFDEKITAADGAVKVLGGSLAGVVGVLGTLGIESEAFGEFEKKAASAIAVAVGLKDISEGARQLLPAFKAAGDGAKLFGITTRKALIATGIGAFVVAIGTVIAYWDDITAAIDGSSQSAEDLNRELNNTKELSEGTYGVLESQKALLEGQGKSTVEVNKQLLHQLEIQIGITEQMIAQKQLELEEEKEENRKVSFWEKMKIGALSYFNLYGAQAKAIGDAINENSDETKEKQQEIFDLQTNLNNLKLKQIGLEGEVATQAEMAAGPQQALQVATRGIVDTTVALGEQLQANAPLLDENTAKNLLAASAQRTKNQQTQDAIKKEQENREGLAATGQALGQLGSVLNQESAAAKALGISTAIINTYLGVTEVLKQKSTLPSPFDVITKIANVATILASGFKAVKGIKSTPVQSSGGGSVPGNITAPVRGPRGATAQDVQSLVPQIETVQPTVKAYVLSGDVTSAQEADAKLNRKRTIAG